MLPADYHIHTKLCGHASGEGEEYIEIARKAGLREIGFSDHIPQYFLPAHKRDYAIAMKEEELPGYVAMVQSWRDKCSDITIKLGIEADFAPGQEEALRKILAAYEFDYVLGSVHYLDSWGFDNAAFLCVYERWDVNELYRHYFGLIQQLATSGLFDIVAHTDLIKKFAFFPTEDISGLYQETVKTIAKSGLCVEINTSGLRVPAGELYPSEMFLQLCFDAGVPVTLGSDAHCPEQVGYEFAKAIEFIKKVGYHQTAVFNKRKRILVNL